MKETDVQEKNDVQMGNDGATTLTIRVEQQWTKETARQKLELGAERVEPREVSPPMVSFHVSRFFLLSQLRQRRLTFRFYRKERI